jgi:hypothetical protein
MQRTGLFALGVLCVIVSQGILFGCSPTNSVNVGSANMRVSNSNSASNANSVSSFTSPPVETQDPDQYQATVKLSLQTMGSQPSSLPTLGAVAARAGDDRVMEFNLPTNEKVIFLDKRGMNYIIFPSRKQFAELDRESLGFDVRRMMMPEEMVQQAKAMPGMTKVDEQVQDGRQVVKYAYQATANTNTTAGTVDTQAYLLVDKETGLPLHTETTSTSESGNVNGVNGVRVVTEMSDIKTSPDMSLFDLPTDYQKIDPVTVRAQVNLIFNAVAAVIGEAIQQQQQMANSNAMPSPTASAAR